MTAARPVQGEYPTVTAPEVQTPAVPGHGASEAAEPVARLSVIVPVYNERNTLPALLQRVQDQQITWQGRPVAVELIVVDDCSNDGGVDFLEQEAGRAAFPTVRLIRHERNRGKGAAIRTGLAYASGDVVLIQDADLEYDPADYQTLLAPLLAGEAEVVYGSRFLGRRPLSRPPGMHPANWLANKLLSWTASALFMRRVTDEATCYKALSRSLLLDLNLRAERFDICPEITAKVLRRGQAIHEVPIAYHGRGSNDGKKIRWTDAFRAWFTLLRYRFLD
ncbi:MAG TPA: glycosyltransferase family 2 protein [Chloroflexota bacterium]|nr:glycosyltransferase family 2 protein [Chloroflexota bacterium]